MAADIEAKLKELGLSLPTASPPAGSYVPYIVHGSTLYIAGQVPFRDGTIAVTGLLGDEVSLEAGQEAARICLLNILAQAKAACGGDFAKLDRCLKLGGFVASTPAFTDHPKVMNAASELLAQVMGEAGRHVRFAVGASSLPLGSAVEVEAIFALA